MEKLKTVEKYFPGTKTLWERYEIKDGKMHGTCEVFHKSGEIKSRTGYVEDKLHGTRERFYESGEIMSRTGYVDGKMHGTDEEFYQNGKIMYRIEYVEGKRHGTNGEFYRSGGIAFRTEYVEDKLHGTREEFYESGEIGSRTEYVEGEKHGTREEFYASGGIEFRTEYVEDKLHGTHEEFYESGGINFRTEYVEGKRHGPHRRYTLKGDLVLDIVLEDGRQINIKDSLNVVNLDKIIDFLDELPTEKFDFAEVRSECGSKACVVGWFPNIFPEVEYTSPYFRLNSMGGLKYNEVASFILNVSKDIARDLFSPLGESSELFPTLPVCGSEATPEEVSAMLKAFKELVMAS